jgi:hypothetical protein
MMNLEQVMSKLIMAIMGARGKYVRILNEDRPGDLFVSRSTVQSRTALRVLVWVSQAHPDLLLYCPLLRLL